MKKTLKVEGMSCGHCKMRVEKALGGLEGIHQVVVNLDKGEVEVSLDEQVTNDQLVATVDDAGYDVTSIQ